MEAWPKADVDPGVEAWPNAEVDPGVDAWPNAEVGAVAAFMNGFDAVCDTGADEACEKGFGVDDWAADGFAPFARSMRLG